MNVKRFDSSEETVSKYVFEFDRAGVAEAVLYKYPDFETRTVICCSTQSGCLIGCSFCGTGRNFIRSLTAEEIVAQPVYLMQDRKIDVDKVCRLQIMFMSMGEPLLNFEQVALAIRQLHNLYPKAELLISTSAPNIDFKQLNSLSREIPQIGLQFSIHESTDDARNKLIPFKNKLSLQEIADEGEKWHKGTGRTPFFNYCIYSGNISEYDADRLRALFDPTVWRVTLSVICEKDESIASAIDCQLEISNNFRLKLQKRGFNVQIFNPAGQDDIGGGCGQLWYVQKWIKEHPEHVNKI